MTLKTYCVSNYHPFQQPKRVQFEPPFVFSVKCILSDLNTEIHQWGSFYMLRCRSVYMKNKYLFCKWSTLDDNCYDTSECL